MIRGRRKLRTGVVVSSKMQKTVTVTLTWNDYDRTILFQTRATDTLPLEIGGLTFTGGIRPDLYALGSATTLLSLTVIGVLLALATLRLRLRRAPVRRVRLRHYRGI